MITPTPNKSSKRTPYQCRLIPTLGIKMAAAKDNEKFFLEKFEDKVKGINLSKQNVYSINDDKGRKLSSSVDYYFEYEGRQILIEIDSYNMAKVVVGQYTLLNQLRNETLRDPVFLVVHTYSEYNPDRTIKYLEHINEFLLQGKGIPFGVIHINTLMNWSGGDAKSFIKLFNV